MLVRRNPLWYGAARRLFDRLEGASAHERQTWTAMRLDALLAAARTTGYGRKLGTPGAIDEWPILEKNAIRDDPRSFVNGSVRLSSSAATSGTTGVPLDLWRSFRSVTVEQAAIDRLLERAGVDPRSGRIAVLRGDDIKDPSDRTPPFWMAVAGGRRLVFSSNHLGADTIAHFANALTTFGPDVLYAYPTVLESLCRLLRDSGHSVSIPVTLTSSETMPASTWRIATDIIGSHVVDYYGLAERVSFASAFRRGAYRFLPGYSFNELIALHTAGDEHVYELVATGLWNLKMPLIRFRTGDLVRLHAGADPTDVAYGCAVFDEVVGRTGDYLVAPDGAHLMGIDHIPRGVRHIERMQVIQERRDAVTLLVVPAEGFTDEDRATILANAAKKLPPTMAVFLEVTSVLERTAAGKVPFVRRRADL
jgi:phenylacetate-CoA ligase